MQNARIFHANGVEPSKRSRMPIVQGIKDGKRNNRKKRKKGYIVTEFGRRRYLPDINSRNATVRGYAERNAVNAPIQGTAADIIKLAMVAIDRRMREEGLKSVMMLQVHDELNFSVIPEELDRMRQIVTSEMERAYRMSVPLTGEACFPGFQYPGHLCRNTSFLLLRRSCKASNAAHCRTSFFAMRNKNL